MGSNKGESHKGQGEESREGESKRKREAKEKDKGKAKIGKTRQGTTELGIPPRKKTRDTKLTYQAMLHDDDVNTIADRVCESMIEPITAVTTVQEAMKKAIEVQLTELKSLVSHSSHVAIQTPV